MLTVRSLAFNTNTKDLPESDGNQSDTLSSNQKSPSEQRAKEEEDEAIEEDALEEQRRDASVLEKINPPSEPVAAPMFHNSDTLDDDPLFGEEENDDTAVVSLILTVATAVKSKKKLSFRSLRTKRKK